MQEDLPTESLIFRTDDQAIKFFIQKDLDENVVEQLQNKIKRHGGRVETKVPLQGFLLIDPDTAEGQRLTECWGIPDRPNRHIVPFTFAEACLHAGKLIPQVFKKDGVSIRIHIHSSITGNLVDSLTSCVLHSGGRVVSGFADVLVADEDWSGFQGLVERFDHYQNKYVEGIPWVEECIESGVYKNTPVVKKNYGGRIAGSRRIEFTAQDDRHLAGYIATRLPDPTMRGRTGNKLYQDLCSKSDLYPWAQRHPWQSWRERYKNNIPGFHKLINAQVARNPPPESGKGMHGFVRAPSSAAKANTKSPSVSKETGEHSTPVPSNVPHNSDDEWNGSQWDIREGSRSPPTWGKGKGKRKEMTEDMDAAGLSEDQSLRKSKKTRVKDLDESSPSIVGELIPPSAPREYQKIDERFQATNVTRDNNDELSQTQSSSYDMNDIGSETQALLDANRNLIGLVNDELPHFDNSFDKGESGMELARTPVPLLSHSDVHGLLNGIASEYRFSFEEVEEVYREMNRDINITEHHFQEIRMYITEKRKELRMQR